MSVRFQGIIPPMVTPFDDSEDIDTQALQGEAEYLIGVGCTALTVGGSTGEGAGFSPEDVRTAVRAVVSQSRGRVPVIAGVIPDTTREAISLGKVAREAGADALQITPPHYLFPPGPDETVDYYRATGRAVGLPIIVYNVVPWATINVPTLIRVLDLPEVCGVKQSGGDIHKLSELLHVARGKASILTAVDDLLYPSFVLGADGAVAAILTAVPTLCVALFDAVQRQDHVTALQVHNRLAPLWMALSGPNLPARVKIALKIQGRHGGRSRRPMTVPSGEDARGIREALEQANLVPVA
ncbi:MAG TPA: dihydrodipicolinate synthase family protein [bacterium]|nr:dihydrodipicolinate synthase family protein [bacterium]